MELADDQVVQEADADGRGCGLDGLGDFGVVVRVGWVTTGVMVGQDEVTGGASYSTTGFRKVFLKGRYSAGAISLLSINSVCCHK